MKGVVEAPAGDQLDPESLIKMRQNMQIRRFASLHSVLPVNWARRWGCRKTL